MGYKLKYTSGEPKQKDKQRIINIFNRMTVDDAFNEIKQCDEDAGYLVWILRKLVCNNKGENPYKQLQAFKKYVPMIIDTIVLYEAIADYSFEQVDRLLNGIDVNKNKKWEPEDEEALINMVCDDVDDVEIAMKFGRSVPAIKTKVSQLVGIGRIDRKVAGRFVGRINGEEVDAMINGKVFKTRLAEGVE